MQFYMGLVSSTMFYALILSVVNFLTGGSGGSVVAILAIIYLALVLIHLVTAAIMRKVHRVPQAPVFQVIGDGLQANLANPFRGLAAPLLGRRYMKRFGPSS